SSPPESRVVYPCLTLLQDLHNGPATKSDARQGRAHRSSIDAEGHVASPSVPLIPHDVSGRHSGMKQHSTSGLARWRRRSHRVALLHGWSAPRARLTLLECVASCGQDETVSAKAEGMSRSSSNSHDAVPAGHIALSMRVVAGGEYVAFGVYRHCVKAPGSDGNYVAPRGGEGWCSPPITGHEDSAAGSDSNSVTVARCDGPHGAPSSYLTLTPLVVPNGHDGPIGSEADAMPVSRCNRNNLRPRLHVARALPPTANCSNCSVG
ncbi:hypothetical protein ACUXNS_002973, partial [Brevibacterium pityocampae]